MIKNNILTVIKLAPVTYFPPFGKHLPRCLLEAEAFHSLTRLPETTFYTKRSTRILQFCILQGYPYRKEILHSEGKEIFKYFQSSYKTFQRLSRHPSHKTLKGHSRHSSHSRHSAFPGNTTCIQGFHPSTAFSN